MGEIRGAPAVQRQAAMEPGNGDNWKQVKEAKKTKEVEQRYSQTDRRKKIPERRWGCRPGWEEG